jgi:hypothetical protein
MLAVAEERHNRCPERRLVSGYVYRQEARSASVAHGDSITADAVPHALDHAVRKLRESGAPVASWATFIHVGA